MSLRCAVENAELEVYLVQVEPGQEGAVARHFARAKVPHWQALGKYDLTCVVAGPFEGGRDRIPREWFGQHVLDWVEVAAFAWSSAGGGRALRRIHRAASRHDWVALVLAKIDPDWLLQGPEAPVARERRLAQQVQRRLRSRLGDAVVLGGLGWHELVVLCWGDDLGALAREIVGLSRSIGGGPRRSRIRKTFTIFGVNYAFLRQKSGRRWRELDRPSHHPVHTQVFIACKSASLAAARPIVRSICSSAWRVDMVYGTEDFVLVPDETIGLGTVLRTVAALRNDAALQEVVYSTSTMVTLDCQALSAAPRTAPPSRPPAQLSGDIRHILSQGAGLRIHPGAVQKREPQILDVRANATLMDLMLRSSLEDVFTQDAYLDMVPALAAFSRRAPSAQERLGLNGLKTVLDYVGLGYQQRSRGTLTALWNVGNPIPMFYRGGIQRRLWAAEFLCHSLLDQVGQAWDGFAVFGMVRDYLRSHLGIVSFPYRTLFHPCEWWGIFHEVGHEYVHKAREQMGDARWTELLSRIFGIPTDDVRGRRDMTVYFDNVCWEILSDVFDYRVGFGEDWRLYCDMVLAYIVSFCLAYESGRKPRAYRLTPGSRERSLLEFYLARLLAVYLYRSRAQRRTQAPPCFDGLVRAAQPSLDRALAGLEVPQRLRRALDKGIQDVLRPQELERIARMYRIRRLFQSDEGRALFQETVPKRTREPASLREDIQRLKRGEILDEVRSPQAIICALLRLRRRAPSGEIAPRVRIATLLSFWNAYARVLPKRLRAVAQSLS